VTAESLKPSYYIAEGNIFLLSKYRKRPCIFYKVAENVQATSIRCKFSTDNKSSVQNFTSYIKPLGLPTVCGDSLQLAGLIRVHSQGLWWCCVTLRSTGYLALAPNRFGVSLPSPEDGNRSCSRNFVSSSYLELRKFGKFHKPRDSEVYFSSSRFQTNVTEQATPFQK
jgi:hypothetical protein